MTGIKGCIHIYCGDGKGKTTAATGLSVRASGAGIPVIFCQFMKSDCSSEILVLKGVPGITVLHAPRFFGFSWTLQEKEKKEAEKQYRELFWTAVKNASKYCDKANSEKVSALLILDELISACNTGMIDEKAVLEWIARRPENLEIVITGRNPSERLLSEADYITEMKMRRHPYEQGIKARIGIEY